jgi:hypothetical protein
MGEKTAHGRGRDGLRDPRVDARMGQLGTIPLGEAAPPEVRAFTSQFDEMESPIGGERPVGARIALYPPVLGCHAGGSV